MLRTLPIIGFTTTGTTIIPKNNIKDAAKSIASTVQTNVTEECNGLDDDGDGIVDEDPVITCYRDADFDGVGSGTPIILKGCDAPLGYSKLTGDCDDNNTMVGPHRLEQCDRIDNDCDGLTDENLLMDFFKDEDGDGFGTGLAVKSPYCMQPIGYTFQSGDCDDKHNGVYPGAIELCDGRDNDCDGLIDDQCTTQTFIFYRDKDRDGYGDSRDTIIRASVYQGYSTKSGDCNDEEYYINPDAFERCDGKDNNCDGIIDQGNLERYYRDLDGDGYGGGMEYRFSSCNAVPSGYVTNNLDKNDNNKAIYFNAPELCDGLDNNGNGWIDENAKTLYYDDLDGDGYGNSAAGAVLSCSSVPGKTTQTGDCNDTKASVYPDAPELCDGIDNNCDGKIDEWSLNTYYVDNDGDGYGSSSTIKACDLRPGLAMKGGDCNDANNKVYPLAPELCDQLDNNCNGQVDEGIPIYTYYKDSDLDGFGEITSPTVISCNPVAPYGYANNNSDCNALNASIYPGAPELCDGVDNNCDGKVDEGCSVLTTYYRDADGDGYGNPSVMQMANTQPVGYVTKASDCNDASNTIYPGAQELCDRRDNDCDGLIDEGLPTKTYYRDRDGDGFGSTSTVIACSPPSGYTANPGDCNDGNVTVYPGAPELCDGLDNDCDGVIDDGLPLQTFYKDSDKDGYGSTSIRQACSAPPGYVSLGGDCNDGNAQIYPGKVEVANGLDDDCDGIRDEGFLQYTFYLDYDKDGWGGTSAIQANVAPLGYVASGGDCNDRNALVKPGAVEICNNVDDDCDGTIDEGFIQYTYYYDRDGDGIGSTTTIKSCSTTPPAGYTTKTGDCNDRSNLVFPGAPELCDALDNDCDGIVDDGLILKTFYKDSDRDGYGSTSTVQTCIAPVGYVSVSGDCNDGNALIYPGKAEIDNGLDDDCDGLRDEGFTQYTFYLDNDKDGYGGTSTVQANVAPAGYVAKGGDCNDKNNTIYPGAPELCDALDNDCDGVVDDGLVLKTFYRDRDGDGFGGTSTFIACKAPSGYVSTGGDCNDYSATVKPGAVEIAGNGIDDNCNGLKDETTTTSVATIKANMGGLQVEEHQLSAEAYPNPSSTYFTLITRSSSDKAIQLRMLDAVGRVIETKADLATNSTLVIGYRYRPGIYYAEVVQGTQKVTLKLVKRP